VLNLLKKLLKVHFMIVTKKWIESNTTPRGAWTARQLACIGVSWPPIAGWKDRVCGTKISGSAAKSFEQLGKAGRAIKQA